MLDFFKSVGKNLEAKRLNERTLFDIEMMQELGYCSGIENYSRYIDGREPGTRPFCLIDYFPDEFLTIIDESHDQLKSIIASGIFKYQKIEMSKQNTEKFIFDLMSRCRQDQLKEQKKILIERQKVTLSSDHAIELLREIQEVELKLLKEKKNYNRRF